MSVVKEVKDAEVRTAAGDFTHTAGLAHFAALSTTPQTVSVPIADDNIVEATETFTASLSTATLSLHDALPISDTGTGTIQDNDTAVYTINDVTVNEAAGTLDFTVSV